MMKQKTFEKSSEEIWKLKIKVVIFAPTFVKWTHKFFERFTYQQVVQETYMKNTKHTVKDYNKETRFWAKVYKKQINNEEFDPGSGWTLATGLTHASRGAAWFVAIQTDGDRRTGE